VVNRASNSVLLFGRRIAVFILAIVMFFLAAPVPVVRTALSAGTAVGCSLLALLGVYAYTSCAQAGLSGERRCHILLALGYIRYFSLSVEACGG